MGSSFPSALRQTDAASLGAAAALADFPADNFGSLTGLGAPRKFKKKPVLVLDPEELAAAHAMFQQAEADIMGEEAATAVREENATHTVTLGLAPMDEEHLDEELGQSDEVSAEDEDDLPDPEAVLALTRSREAALEAEGGLDDEDQLPRIFPTGPALQEPHGELVVPLAAPFVPLNDEDEDEDDAGVPAWARDMFRSEKTESPSAHQAQEDEAEVELPVEIADENETPPDEETDAFAGTFDEAEPASPSNDRREEFVLPAGDADPSEAAASEPEPQAEIAAEPRFGDNPDEEFYLPRLDNLWDEEPPPPAAETMANIEDIDEEEPVDGTAFMRAIERSRPSIAAFEQTGQNRLRAQLLGDSERFEQDEQVSLFARIWQAIRRFFGG